MPQGGGRRLVFQAPHWLVAMSTPSAAASWEGIKSHPHCRVRFLKRSNSMRQTKTRVKPWPRHVPSQHTAPLQQKFLLSAYSWIESRRPECNASASYLEGNSFETWYGLLPLRGKPAQRFTRCGASNFGKIWSAIGQHEIQWMSGQMDVYNLLCAFFYTSYVIKYTRHNRKSW